MLEPCPALLLLVGNGRLVVITSDGPTRLLFSNGRLVVIASYGPTWLLRRNHDLIMIYQYSFFQLCVQLPILLCISWVC